jgi:hypothetical protein
MQDKPNLNALAIDTDEQGNYSIYAYFPYVYAPGEFMWKDFGWYTSHDGGISWSIANACAWYSNF